MRTPTARAAGIADLEIVVDTHEQYPYRFATQQVSTVKRALPCGDYGLVLDGGWSPSVERKSLVDLVASLTGGKLRYAVAELAALPRAAVVVEDRYSQLFKLDRVRPAVVADGLAELHIRWPAVPIVFCETRQLAEEWTYRYLAAAHAWAITEHPALQRISPGNPVESTDLDRAPAAPEPTTAEVRAWARGIGLAVPDRGRLRPKSGKPGATRTPRPDIRGPVVGVTHQPRRDGPDAAPDSADLPRMHETTRVSQQEREAQTTAAVHDSFVRRRQRLCVRQSVGRVGWHTLAVLERDRSSRPATRTQWS